MQQSGIDNLYMTSVRTGSIVRHTCGHHIFTSKRHDRHKAIDSRHLGPIAACRQSFLLRHALCRIASCVCVTTHAITGASSHILAAGLRCLHVSSQSSQYLAEFLADDLTYAVCRHRTLAGHDKKVLVDTLSSCYCHSIPIKFSPCRALASMPRAYTLAVQKLLTLPLKERLAFICLFATLDFHTYSGVF